MKKKAFVTGADRGLGYCLTEVLLVNDYRVFAGRYMKDWPWLDRLKAKYGDDLILVDLDISSSDSVEKAARLIKSETDSLDLLINNAAILGPDENNLAIFEPLDFDRLLRVYNVNTLGALRVTKALIDLVLNSQDKLIV
ncbi:MAG TPA: SDR family NAD(P)-dependent oxidoreductase, partial [Candidatus Atribacteria bacterium]|nr:SDR family NAD(P)-dependent oxidoreductase [Candidatus Atribacteria bacterium]